MAIKHRKPNDSIKQELKRLGISQTQAAFDLRINKVMFNTIANGWQVPGSDIRKRISEYLGMSEHDLFSEM